MSQDTFHAISLSSAKARWSLVMGEKCLVKGKKPFVRDLTGDINLLNDFSSKRDAMRWVADGCPLNEGETLIWAVDFIQANNKWRDYERKYMSGGR